MDKSQQSQKTSNDNDDDVKDDDDDVKDDDGDDNCDDYDEATEFKNTLFDQSKWDANVAVLEIVSHYVCQPGLKKFVISFCKALCF